jgi:lipopolysaccharide/colanic/teichoic acid biosynthesis glycosyltransferase
MTIFRPRTAVLFLGDICFFAISLWLSLFLRAFELPTQTAFAEHLTPFSILFIVWVIVFFIAGLYESRSIIFARRALSTTLLVAQIINIILAALFFFFIPYFGIEPKTLLLIYLIVSFLLVLSWRAFFFPLLGLQKPENAIFIGAGQEFDELVSALRIAHRAPARVARVIDPSDPTLANTIAQAMRECNPRFIIADFTNARISAAFPELYNYLLRQVRFFDSADLFEEVFGRVPLSRIDESWVARNASRSVHLLYDPLKRLIDIVAAFFIGIISLVFYPFIMLAIWLEDHGQPFVSLQRVGLGGRIFEMYKFRSMTGNDQGNYGPGGRTQLKITRVGKFLRAWRLDEFPQILNVLRGDLSLVGPRPETPALVAAYERDIPFYGVRHLIKPGLSGSAQLYYHGDPHGAADVGATTMKLSYDIFYLKHRSLSLDLSICFKTIRRIVSRSNN